MFNTVLFNQVANIAILLILLLLLGIQWIIFFADNILQKLGFHSSSQQVTKIPIISGVVSPSTIPKALQQINASDPSKDNYLQIIPSYNQSSGLSFSISLWLNVDSQQSTDVSRKVLFYKGSNTLVDRLQFKDSIGLFHLDVSNVTSVRNNDTIDYSAEISYPNDPIVLNLINNLQSQSNQNLDQSKIIRYIVLIFNCDAFYQVSYQSTPKSINLKKIHGPELDLRPYKVLKFAGFSRNQAQNLSSGGYYIKKPDYIYKTPLLCFGDSVNDILFEFNDNKTINSYSYQLFSKNSQAYTLNFNKFIHLVITVNDHLDSNKKPSGTDIKFYVDGNLIKTEPIDSHIHFNYGDFFVFPPRSENFSISSRHNDDPKVQIADLTYYRQALTPASISALYKAGHSTALATVKSTKKTSTENKTQLSTQNLNT